MHPLVADLKHIRGEGALLHQLHGGKRGGWGRWGVGGTPPSLIRPLSWGLEICGERVLLAQLQQSRSGLRLRAGSSGPRRAILHVSSPVPRQNSTAPHPPLPPPVTPGPPPGGSSECPGTPCPRCRPRGGPSTRARWRRRCMIGVGFRSGVTSGGGQGAGATLFIPAPAMTPSPQPRANPATPVPHVVCWKHAAAIPVLCGRSCAEARDCSPLKACTRAMATADEANLTRAAGLYSVNGVFRAQVSLCSLAKSRCL